MKINHPQNIEPIQNYFILQILISKCTKIACDLLKLPHCCRQQLRWARLLGWDFPEHYPKEKNAPWSPPITSFHLYCLNIFRQRNTLCNGPYTSSPPMKRPYLVECNRCFWKNVQIASWMKLIYAFEKICFWKNTIQ